MIYLLCVNTVFT